MSLHTMPRHTMPLHTMPLHTMPLDTMPLHTMPLHTMPLHTMPLHTQLAISIYVLHTPISKYVLDRYMGGESGMCSAMWYVYCYVVWVLLCIAITLYRYRLVSLWVLLCIAIVLLCIPITFYRYRLVSLSRRWPDQFSDHFSRLNFLKVTSRTARFLNLASFFK